MSQDEGVTQRPMQSVDDVASSNSSENAKQQRDELKTRGLDNDQSSTMGKVKNVSFDNNRKDDKKKNENKITFSTHRRSLKISARDFHGTSSSSKSEQKPVSMVPIILLFIFAIGLLLLVALVTVNDIGRNRKEGGVKQPLTTLGIKRKWKAQDAQKNRPAQIRKDSICSLHIAESSLRANVGFGLFAARHFKKGEIIIHPGPTFPHQSIVDDSKDLLARQFDLYLQSAGVLHYNPHNESQFFVAPHLMTLIKPHPVLVNVERKHVDYLNVAEVKLDGVSTSFAIVASRDILAGEEFFSDYNGWLRNDDHDMMNVANLSIFFSAVPLSNHYERADAIVKDLISSVKPVSPRKRKMNQIEDRVAESLPVHTSLLNALKTIVSRYDPVTAELLPSYYSLLLKYSEQGSALSSLQKRSMEWLDENAHCIDMIRPGMSTIPNAGLGAFATTLIQKGDLVSTSPVFVIPNRKYLAPSSLLHWTKYCWGRSDSLVLICPSTFAALINHGEKPSGDGVECSAHGTSCRATLANVEYRWSPWNTKANVYLDKSIRDMQASTPVGLSVDYVATRDIYTGEEVLVDYGDELKGPQNSSLTTFDESIFSMTMREGIFPSAWRFSHQKEEAK